MAAMRREAEGIVFAGKRKVRFVYSAEFRHSGSTVMRGQQLASTVKNLYGRQYDVRFSPTTEEFKSSVLFLTKGALKTVSPATLEGWKSAGNTILFDLVDESPNIELVKYADRVVAASITAFRAYSMSFPGSEVVLVNHHVDPRIPMPFRHVIAKKAKAGYFGETVNAVLEPQLNRVVDSIHIDTSNQQDDKWLAALPHYDVHYAVRRERELDHFKPFLKGFTAAHCDSNIVIQRGQTEAVEWLGEDYPYLVDGPNSSAEIVDAVERALADRGSRRWTNALSTMADIKQRTSPQRIAAEFIRAIN